MELNDILEQRKSNQLILDNFIKIVETEDRKLNETEQIEFDEVKNKIIKLDKVFDERKIQNTEIKNNKKEKMEKYSLIKNIRDIVEGRAKTEETLGMFDKGKGVFSKAGISYRGQIILPLEQRANILAKTSTQGEEVVAEDKFDMIGKLRDTSVVMQAGANLMTGLVGDISIPVYAGTTAAWKTEVASADDGGSAFSEVDLEPFRITAYVDISKNFLLQDSSSAEQLLYSDMTSSTLDLLEATIFDVEAAGSRPAGMFNGVSYTVSGNTTWANFVSMESAVATNNALKGKLAYIVNPTCMGDLKTTAKDAGSGLFISDGMTANGYPIYSSGHLPTISGALQGSIFGNFEDLIIGQWGGLDITVDPYSLAITGQVRLVINSYWGWVKRRATSFSYGALG